MAANATGSGDVATPEEGLPFLSPWMSVPSDWIDYNGHMNMAYYNRAFDLGVDAFFDVLGIGERYRAERDLTTFTAEFHTRFLREMKQDDRFRVATRIVDHDAKRLHMFQEIHHADGWVSATGECLSLHIDISGPKVAPFPDDIAANVASTAAAHAALPQPAGIGAVIGIRRRPA